MHASPQDGVGMAAQSTEDASAEVHRSMDEYHEEMQVNSATVGDWDPILIVRPDVTEEDVSEERGQSGNGCGRHGERGEARRHTLIFMVKSKYSLFAPKQNTYSTSPHANTYKILRVALQIAQPKNTVRTVSAAAAAGTYGTVARST